MPGETFKFILEGRDVYSPDLELRLLRHMEIILKRHTGESEPLSHKEFCQEIKIEDLILQRDQWKAVALRAETRSRDAVKKQIELKEECNKLKGELEINLERCGKLEAEIAGFKVGGKNAE